MRLNPKCWNNRQSAAKARIEQSSTTIPDGSTLQAIGSGSGGHLLKGDDIVYAYVKA